MSELTNYAYFQVTRSALFSNGLVDPTLNSCIYFNSYDGQNNILNILLQQFIVYGHVNTRALMKSIVGDIFSSKLDIDGKI